MKSILNPESKNYIFKDTIHGIGLPLWVSRTLIILDNLPVDYLNKIMMKDPETIYKLYTFNLIYDEAVLTKNEDLLKIFYLEKNDYNAQRYWLNSLKSLSDYLYLIEDGVINNSKNTDYSENYIYSIIEDFYDDKTSFLGK